MLKKAVLAGAVAALATVGVAGVAYADDADSGNSCSAKESTNQHNDHNEQAVGGNANANRIAGGVLVGQIDKVPGVCPSAGNDNDF